MDESRTQRRVLASAASLPKDRSTVWHYTDSSGLVGILDSKSMWASATDALNDSTELTFGVEFFKSEISRFREKMSPGFTKVLENLLLQDWEEQLENEVFICSASLREDSLTQWRGYAGPDGFALGFDSRSKWEPRKETHAPGKRARNYARPIAWQEVLYRPVEQRTALTTFLNDRDIMFEEVSEDEEKFFLQEASSYLLHELSLLLPLFKHEAFVDEAETRIVTGVGYRNAKYRANQRRIVPYLELVPAPVGGQTDLTKLPLKYVMCGPGIRARGEKQIARMLRDFGLEGVVILTSDAPFVS